MKKFVVAAAVAAFGFGSAASAADMPVKAAKTPIVPVYNWTGFYIGLNAGGAASHECLTITSVAGAAVFPNSEGCHDATGGLAGGQLGYRWQTAHWVFGVEAQGDWASLTGSNASLTAIIPYTNQAKVDAIGLFTGQAGYAWNNVLLYVKGGAAVTDNKYSSFFTATGVVFNQASDVRWGGVAGTGVEIGLAPDWSVAVEYDHLFMGNPNVTFPASGIAVTRSDNIGQGVDMGTVRVSYRFGGSVVTGY
jgi:outer membrane immunogenic protein